MTVREIYEVLDRNAPFCRAESWDNSGLLVGDMTDRVTGVTVALDITGEVVADAAAHGHTLIVAHHPVIFDSLKRIGRWHPVYKLIENGITAICCHTPLDVAEGGVNAALIRALGLQDCTLLAPLPGDAEVGYGVIGTLPDIADAEDLAVHVKRALHCDGVRLYDAGRPIERVAVCGGAGGSFLRAAHAAGASAYITADLKHSAFLESAELGMTLLDAGHYLTENPVVERLQAMLKEAFPELEVRISAQNHPPYTTI